MTSKLPPLIPCCSGGTIGLFTGMSLLSMVEVGFWICRAMAALVQRKKVN